MKKNVVNIILLFLGIFLTVGVKLFFAPCGQKEDGSYMTCHWAGEMVFAIGIVLSILAALSIVVKNAAAKSAFSIAILCTAVLTAFVPKHIISLCMMADMKCRSVMQPAVMVTSIIIAVLSIVNVVKNKPKSILK